MEKLPWLVVYAQPQDTFLAPVRAHTRNTVSLTLVIAVLAILADAVGALDTCGCFAPGE